MANIFKRHNNEWAVLLDANENPGPKAGDAVQVTTRKGIQRKVTLDGRMIQRIEHGWLCSFAQKGGGSDRSRKRYFAQKAQAEKQDAWNESSKAKRGACAHIGCMQPCRDASAFCAEHIQAKHAAIKAALKEQAQPSDADLFPAW